MTYIFLLIKITSFITFIKINFLDFYSTEKVLQILFSRIGVYLQGQQ